VDDAIVLQYHEVNSCFACCLFKDDALSYHVGMNFSTNDQDNDISTTRDCAQEGKGGWWYKNCSKANLNGEYLARGSQNKAGMTWSTWKGHTLRKAEMKIRPYDTTRLDIDPEVTTQQAADSSDQLLTHFLVVIVSVSYSMIRYYAILYL